MFRSPPNSLMAIFAFVPDNMASIRWLIGCPISMFAPVIVPSFSRTSATSCCASGRPVQTEPQFRHVHTQCARLIQFGTSRFAGNGLYLRNGQQQLFRALSHFVALFQRDTRQRTDIDCERTFVEKKGKLRPSVKNTPSATMKRAIVPPSVTRLCASTQDSAFS